MALSDRQLLDSLNRMPFVESTELALVLGEPHSTIQRRLTDLMSDGIAGRVSHGTAHLPPKIVSGIVYIGAARGSKWDGGDVYALDAANGQILRLFSTEVSIFSSVPVGDGKVYVGDYYADYPSGEPHMHALGATAGEVLWGYPMHVRLFASPAEVDGAAYVASPEGSVFALVPPPFE